MWRKDWKPKCEKIESLYSFLTSVNIMKRKFKEWWSTVPPILALDGHNYVAGLNRLIDSQTSPLHNLLLTLSWIVTRFFNFTSLFLITTLRFVNLIWQSCLMSYTYVFVLFSRLTLEILSTSKYLLPGYTFGKTKVEKGMWNPGRDWYARRLKWRIHYCWI